MNWETIGFVAVLVVFSPYIIAIAGMAVCLVFLAVVGPWLVIAGEVHIHRAAKRAGVKCDCDWCCSPMSSD